MSIHDVEAVELFGKLLSDLLERAQSKKDMDTIEPPLIKHDFADLLQQLRSIDQFSKTIESKKSIQYAVIETAVRDVFYGLLVRTCRAPRTIRSDYNRPLTRSMTLASSKYGISWTLYLSFRMTKSAIQPFCSGLSRSFWTARKSRAVAKYLIIWSRDESALPRSISSKKILSFSEAAMSFYDGYPGLRTPHSVGEFSFSCFKVFL